MKEFLLLGEQILFRVDPPPPPSREGGKNDDKVAFSESVSIHYDTKKSLHFTFEDYIILQQ